MICKSSLLRSLAPTVHGPPNDAQLLYFFSLVSIFFFIGCATAKGPVNKEENLQEVQSAVIAVTDAIQKKNVTAKYCPVCGKHFSGRLETCPQDKTPLKEVEE